MLKPRRVQRPLPYSSVPSLELAVQVLEQPRTELSPHPTDLLAKALQSQFKRGKPPSQFSPRMKALLLQDNVSQAEAMFLLTAARAGDFAADYLIVAGGAMPGVTEAERLEAAERLAQSELRLVPLQVDWLAEAEYARAGRGARGGGPTVVGEALPRSVMAAVIQAVAEARQAQPEIHAYLTERRLKYTGTTTVETIVPGRDLQIAHLRSWLRSRVEALVEREFGPEFGLELALGKPVLSLDQMVESRPNRVARSHGGWVRSEVGARRVSGARLVGVAETEKEFGAGWYPKQPHLFSSRPLPPDRRGSAGSRQTDSPGEEIWLRSWGPYIERDHKRVGYVDGVSVEVLAAPGLAALEALEADKRLRHQRAQKLEQVRTLATPEQRKLLETVRESGWPEQGWEEVAERMGKRGPAVRKLVQRLRNATAALEAPGWVAGPALARRRMAGRQCHTGSAI